MKRDFYKTPKPSRLMKLFWKAAGADSYILERSTYSDQIKYTCLGGIVVATGMMAGIAGGYAFYTIFEPKGSALDTINTVSTIARTNFETAHLPTVFMSIIFGIIWGLVIFNIDRFIVTSTGKGDGTEAITAQELKSAIPRIIMGMIIAITISKPVEIRMFKSEIDVELYKMQNEKKQEHLAQIDSLYAGRIANEKQKIEKWVSEIRDKTDRSVELENQYIEEARIVTVGPRARAIKEQWDLVKKEEDLLKSKYQPLIDTAYTNIKKFEDEKQSEINSAGVVASGLDGLLERILIVHKIAGFWITAFITLLFMAIELTPIFFKLMLVKGPYDFMEDNIKELIKAENGIEVKYEYYRDKIGQERDLIIYHHAQRLIEDKINMLETQKELSDTAVKLWKEKQSKDIETNLNDYIKVENGNKT